MKYGGFIEFDGNLQPAPDERCTNCEKEGKCEIWEWLKDDARNSFISSCACGKWEMKKQA